MRIVYMGTPDFAVPALDLLAKSEHEVVAVVTQPDKARDRGKKVQFTPVKAKALEFDIPVYQPEKVKTNEECYQQLVELAPWWLHTVRFYRCLFWNCRNMAV